MGVVVVQISHMQMLLVVYEDKLNSAATLSLLPGHCLLWTRRSSREKLLLLTLTGGKAEEGRVESQGLLHAWGLGSRFAVTSQQACSAPSPRLDSLTHAAA